MKEQINQGRKSLNPSPQEIDTECQLAQWAGSVLGEQESVRKRFLETLMSLDKALDENDWKLLEEKAKMLVETKEKR